MEMVFAYLAGLLTLINPCVVPVLPIVLASSLHHSRFGPVALAAGMSVTFVAVGLAVASVGPALGISPDTIATIGGLIMAGFGLVLLVPKFSAGFATATAGVAASADAGVNEVTGPSSGATGQFLGGSLLGLVWSPCIGPTLGGAIALASQGENLVRAGAIMTAFALGVSTLIIGIAYGARKAVARNQAFMRAIASRSRPIIGAVFLAVGLAIFFKLHHVIEFWAIEYLPIWLTDLSVSI
jgi:cytochrome c biogenesis protein CcdA